LLKKRTVAKTISTAQRRNFYIHRNEEKEMNVTLVGSIPRGNMLSLIDENEKRRVVAFTKKDDAKKCIKYVSTFRSMFGVWPETNLTDMSKPVTLKHVARKKTRTIQNISNFFYTIDCNNSSVDELCTVYNIPLLLIHSFDYTPLDKSEFQVMLSAQHLNCQPDFDLYTSQLNHLFYSSN